MENSIFIARIFGLFYLVMGIGFLYNRKAFQLIMEDFSRNTALLFFSGILALMIGIVIILSHNVWITDWSLMITIIGWAALIKGIWIIVFPNSVVKFIQVYQKNKRLLIVHPIVALALGVILTFFGFFARI